MTRFIHSFSKLDLASLRHVYSVDHMGKEENAEDLYYCFEDLFQQKGAFAAVEAVGERYAAVLRAMPYRDGWLIAGLQTAPELRNRGCATALLKDTLQYIFSSGSKNIYSHVKKDNHASLKVHEACGFVRINDMAAMLDGSVVSTHYTLCAEK